MDATFIGLLQSQINSLQESESGSECNIIALETIKLLLDNMDLSAETLLLYDKFGMRRLFASYGEVGKKVCSFYDEGETYLDPAALNGSIGQTITETEGRIQETSKAFDELTAKEEKLLAWEEELLAIDTKYKELREKAFKLKTIVETVSDEVIAVLEKENQALELEISKGEQKKEKVTDKNQKLRKLLAEIEKTNTEVDNEQRVIKTNVISIIEKHHDDIEAIYDGSNQSLDEVKSDIERYICEFEKLDASVLEYADAKAFYETWLGENSAIIEAMRKYGVESVGQMSDVINNAKANVEYELKAYDTVVKKIITAEELAREAIEKKQNKIV